MVDHHETLAPSPSGAPLRFWRRPQVWLGLVSFVAVVLLFSWEEQRTVPTPISAVHAQEPELLGADDCTSCHGNAEVSLAEACFECHEELGQQISTLAGFHGQAIEGDALKCGECHIEHSGREFPLVGELSFQRAGFDSRAAFDHPFDGYALRGAHDSLECVECHLNAELDLLPPGSRRYGGLRTDCIDCHEDTSHEGKMQRACEACHGQDQPFASLDGFRHDERFPLAGVHQLEDCRQCHGQPGEPDSIETLAGLNHPPEIRGCEDCHESSHDPGFVTVAAALEPGPPANSCNICHLDKHTSFLDARQELTPEQHAASGYPLTAPHDEQECADCHAPQLEWLERFPGRARSDCAACHEDPHRAQFSRDSDFRECADCHAKEHFLPASFDQNEHARTSFPLDYSHQAVGCYACHPPHQGDPTDRDWNRIDQACEACHQDAHEGYFVERLATLGEENTAACADCHQPSSFAEAGLDFESAHQLWTDFPLDGAHAAEECVSCHRASAEVDVLGRSFGRIAEVWGEVPSAARPCASCHADPHEVDFNSAHQPQVIAGRRGCARCHDTSSFATQPFEQFDHEVWTERHLGGAHLELECQDCHRPTSLPDELGRSFGRVRQVFGEEIDRCDTCHLDPHLGLFDGDHAPPMVEGRRECARCHGEDSFARLRIAEFDHDSWTATDLATGHSAQGCDDCHPRLLDPGYASRARAEAGGRSCDACHVDPHAGQFSESGSNTCTECHQDQSSWSELDFDHDRDSRYPLDEVHVDLDCDACHVEYEQLGRPPLVRYKPLGIDCIDCHTLERTGGDG